MSALLTLTPVAAEGFDVRIKNGWGDAQPLPARISVDKEGEALMSTVWVVPKTVMPALIETQAVSVIVLTDAQGRFKSISVAVPQLHIIEDIA